MLLARLAFSAALLACLPGCIARTALDIVKLPADAAGAAVDLATTSQSEADEKRGRELREREERCRERDDEACAQPDAAGPLSHRHSSASHRIRR